MGDERAIEKTMEAAQMILEVEEMNMEEFGEFKIILLKNNKQRTYDLMKRVRSEGI